MRPESTLLVRGLALGLLTLTAPAAVAPQQIESQVVCDELSEPLSLVAGQHSGSCSIDTPTDLDTFTFFADPGDFLRLNVVTFTAADPRFEIRGPDGVSILDQFCDGACSFTAEPVVLVGGTHTLFVSDFGTNHAGAYTFSLERIPPSYAPQIHVNVPVNESISPHTDVDFFRFEGEAGALLRFSVVTFTALDPRLELLEPDGTLTTLDSCDGACSFSVDHTLTQSGTHTLLVSDVGSNHTGAYELSMQCLFGNCPREVDTYCTGKTNADGCVPFLSTSGFPSVTDPAAFVVQGNQTVTNGAGILLYGTKKSDLNFHGGKLCVKLPFVRLPVKSAKNDGLPPCRGRLARNFNATIQGAGHPLLTAGQTVFAQWRYRDTADPAGFGDGLTNGVSFIIQP